MLYKNLMLATICAAACAASTANDTTTIKLHQSPSSDSAVISDISISEGITILPNNWVQVQDPKTKKIGWVTKEEVQNIIQDNNTTITTRTNNSNGNYHSVTEIHNFTNNDISNKDFAAQHNKIKQAFKSNMQYFQKMGEITNNIFDNILGENS